MRRQGRSLRCALCRSLSLSLAVWGPYPTGSRAVGFPGPRQRSGPVTFVLAAYSQCCQLGTVVNWCVVRASVRFTPQALSKQRPGRLMSCWVSRRGTSRYRCLPVPHIPSSMSTSATVRLSSHVPQSPSLTVLTPPSVHRPRHLLPARCPLSSCLRLGL